MNQSAASKISTPVSTMLVANTNGQRKRLSTVITTAGQIPNNCRARMRPGKASNLPTVGLSFVGDPELIRNSA
jgi:hypothetical protein